MPVVSIYLCDRAYGGPEEGGWWYEYGEPCEEFVRFLRVFKTDEQAQAYRYRLTRHLVNKLNVGRPSTYSVNSVGRYRAIIDDGLPCRYPAQRPHYE